ncbi:hypothetical protein C8C76_11736 [Halanaerobium saccharolyticum]|jgi:hypothetical protein|uniref:Uncharacterized protein n=1 Tax=Halanaerobium saccharolyticum TaxID=43595 RepID=A0A2T5RIZ6_9FIRM|nr:hypothetical protein C8C76_11736 [Halanaerobium saccharolyticum]
MKMPLLHITESSRNAKERATLRDMLSVTKFTINKVSNFEANFLPGPTDPSTMGTLGILYETVANALITKNLKHKKTVPLNLQHCYLNLISSFLPIA